MRKLNKIEIKSLEGMSISEKEDLLPKYVNRRIKKMPSYKKAFKIVNMDCNTRYKKFGEKADDQAYNKAWETWHRLYESAIKRTPKLFRKSRS